MSDTQPDRASLVAALDDALRGATALSVLFGQAVADRAGMNATDLESLDLLVRQGPMTAGRLAELTGLTTGAITGLVDRLERRGYARRERHPADRRVVIVQPLFERANRDLGPTYDAMRRAMEELMGDYSDEELAILTDFMTRAAAVTSEQIARVRSETATKAKSIEPPGGNS